MPSLKEVKNRITSVQSTRKITSAMKMVASSKLHKAQQTIENMRPYERHLEAIMNRFVADADNIETPYAARREVKRVAVVTISSNSSLCGAFNQNIIRRTRGVVADYRAKGIEVVLCPIGKKVADAMKKQGLTFDTDHADLLNHPAYTAAAHLAAALMEQFLAGEVDKVELIYNHFKNTSSQVLTHEDFLPLDVESLKKSGPDSGPALDFIIEPSPAEILESLVPTTLHLKIFSAICDSLAAEHSARVIAMQVATDNADELLQELTLTYNKTRQQAITDELLDIAGGSLQ